MSAERPLVYLIAGEPSGDLLGGRLMVALREEAGGEVAFAGVGGAAMTQAGLDSLFPMRELAVMGLVEVLPHLRRLRRRLDETVEHVRHVRPDVVVTIDSPGFTLRVAKRLKGAGIPLVHYVAPSVWAWRPGRARKVAGFLDHLLALLPFEPRYFEVHGLATTAVGHPALEAPRGDATVFRARHALAPEKPLLAVLPGSRLGEVRRLAPLFGETLGRLKEVEPALQVVVPTVDTVAAEVRALVQHWPVPAIVVEPGERPDAFAAARAALAASGTVAVELAVAGVPAVIGYRVNALSAFLARRLIRVRYVSIPNLVLDRPVQPELLQEACQPSALAAEVATLLPDGLARERQLEGYREALSKLSGTGEGTPSRQAARAVLSALKAVTKP